MKTKYYEMSFRYVFEKFLKNPEKYPQIVVFSDDNAVIVRDQFPKSIFHFLVLPRQFTFLRPQVAFQNSRFRKLMQKYVEKAKEILRNEFNQRYEFIDKNDKLESHIKVCCHSLPSMKNLHIHVMTTDLYSDRMKNKKHYNSFTTQFAINWDEMPLDKEDPRFDDIEFCKQLLKQDMIFEGQNYGGHFKQIKQAIEKRFNDTIRLKNAHSSDSDQKVTFESKP